MVQTSPLKSKIIIVCGPTGVGKNEVALQLAEKLGGEIIVADSQAVLKGFDIGTAKPTLEERRKIPHHLVDVSEYGEIFDAARFAELAEQAIEGIFARDHLPIISGGTGLYLKALLYGLMEAPKRDEKLRRELEGRIKNQGLAFLYEELKRVDTKRAGEIHPHDALRIIRALEIFYLTGETPSAFALKHGFKKMRYLALKLGLRRPKEELHARIDERVRWMIEQGWVEEVKKLLSQGTDLFYDRTQPLGYSILAQHVAGKISLEKAMDQIQKETRRLAKRQMTWFRADKEIEWFHPSEGEEILNCAEEFYHPKT